MRNRTAIFLFLSLLSVTRAALAQEQKHPIYVGARVCGSCHDGAGMGHQYSKWLLHKHSQAYASLSKPGSKEIAILSGVPQHPQESPICLGCHATAAETEDWERDPTFFLQDGVQCERCHGPGSEYMSEQVMRDREAAVKAGLRISPKDECMKCHYVKGSHVAVHKRPQMDMEKAWQEFAHPLPESTALPGKTPPSSLAGPASSKAASDLEAGATGPKFVGSDTCGSCHKGPAMGYQNSLWRMSSHARAYARLATPKAFQIAKEQGLQGEPQRLDACLKCHTTGHGEPASRLTATFVREQGIGCESCHGPGSEYSDEAAMRDKRTAIGLGLKPVTAETCSPCHQSAHGKTFDFGEAKLKIAHPTKTPPVAEAPRYKTPVNLAISPDGRDVFVACEASDTAIVLDATSRKKVAEIKVGGQPADVTFSPDGKTVYVSNRLDDTVSVIDVAKRAVTRTLKVGDEPHGVLTDRDGSMLYVLNTASDDISVLRTSDYTEVKRLNAGRNPWSLALSADGSRILVTNTQAAFAPPRKPSHSEVTVIDAKRGVVDDRLKVVETNLCQGVSWHPGGEFGFLTMNRTKSLVPMTKLSQGWTITNGLGIAWNDGTIDQVLLDEPNLNFPDATDVVFTRDGRFALVTSCTSDRVAVVDVEKLTGIIKGASPEFRRNVLPNHRGKATEFISKHIGTGRTPRGISVTPDGKSAFVCNSLDDTVGVIDVDSMAMVAEIDLGGPKEMTRPRFGERKFNDATITFQRQFACHSCHPDGHVDGVTYDIEADGIGVSPVDNRTLRGINDTDPFKWEGTNPSLQRQCGARLSVFFTRLAPFTPDELAAIDNYICTIQRPPNRYRPLGAPLTPAQARGKAIFERTKTKDGRDIPALGRCVTCHFPPLYTDRSKRDVGTKQWLDRQGTFDVPHLNNIYDSAPYLHNGSAATLEEIWTVFNPYDTHGVTNDMTKDELNDLIEFIKTL